MPFVRRGEDGKLFAVSLENDQGFTEELSPDSPELAEFLSEPSLSGTALSETDQDFIRVLEDVVELLIAQGVILFTDLPESAQTKIIRRQHLRDDQSGKLDLLGSD